MELCKEYKTLDITQELIELNESFEIDFQENLPGYLEDVDSIVNCTVNSVITDYECISDSIKLYGKTVISITYIDSSKSVSSCMFEEDFSKTISLSSNTLVNMAKIELITSYSSQRLINQRRIDVHASLKANIRAFCSVNKDVLCLCENACQKETEVSALNLVASNICSEDFDEVFKITDLSSPIKCIVNTFVSCYVEETKIVKDKMLVKSNVELSVLYKNESGAIEKCIHSFAINKIIELSNCDEESKVFVNINPSSIYVKPKADASNSLFEIEVAGRLSISYYVYSAFNYSFLTDLYFTSHKCKNSLFDVILNQNPIFICDSLNDEIDFDIDCDISEVLDLNAKVIKVKACDSCISYQLKLCLFYYSQDGEICYSESIVERKLTINENVNDGTACINLSSFDYVIKNSNKVQLRVSIDYSAYLYESKSISLVKDTELLDTLDDDDCPALVLYFAKQGESTWNIAKNFLTKQDDIISENSLSNEQIDSDRVILIPRM